MDEESWLEAIKSSPHIRSGSWWTLRYADGTEEKFQSSGWLKKLEDEKFRNRVLEIMDEEVVLKFDERTGEAENFYSEE